MVNKIKGNGKWSAAMERTFPLFISSPQCVSRRENKGISNTSEAWRVL
jgi:hypothetical protein